MWRNMIIFILQDENKSVFIEKILNFLFIIILSVILNNLAVTAIKIDDYLYYILKESSSTGDL